MIHEFGSTFDAIMQVLQIAVSMMPNMKMARCKNCDGYDSEFGSTKSA